jgi:hypothetical protein
MPPVFHFEGRKFLIRDFHTSLSAANAISMIQVRKYFVNLSTGLYFAIFYNNIGLISHTFMSYFASSTVIHIHSEVQMNNKGKGKGNVHVTKDHEPPEGE